MSGRTVDMARVRGAEAYWFAGEAAPRIAERLGVHEITIYGWARRFGWAKRVRVRAKTGPRPQPWHAEAQRRYEQGDPCQAIGDALGLAEGTISSVAKRWQWQRVVADPRRPSRLRMTRDGRRICTVCQTPRALSEYSARQGRCKRCACAQKIARCKARPEIRQRELMRKAAKEGRVYRTRAEITATKQARTRAEMLAREERLAMRKAQGTYAGYWIGRLRHELPHLYDATKDRKALIWRARYHLDNAFRARQIERTHMKKARERGGALLSDGSLNGGAVRRLFAHARECLYCGAAMASGDKTLDHIVPRKLGGWHSARNAVVCCRACNTRKAARAPEQWLVMLRPERRAYVEHTWDRITRGAWRQAWLGAA